MTTLRTAEEAKIVANALAAMSAPTPAAALAKLEGQCAQIEAEVGIKVEVRMTDAQIDTFWRDAMARSEAQLDAAMPPPLRPAQRDPDRPRAVSAPEIVEGLEVVALYPIQTPPGERLAKGSRGTVEYPMPGGYAMVVFADAETGEVVRTDCCSWEIGRAEA